MKNVEDPFVRVNKQKEPSVQPSPWSWTETWRKRRRKGKENVFLEKNAECRSNPCCRSLNGSSSGRTILMVGLVLLCFALL